jgi:hypothetical protein
VNNRLGFRCADGARKRLCIKYINHDRLGAELAQRISLVSRPRGADDGVSDCAQQWRELAPDCPACASQKYLHRARSIMPRP